MKVICFDDGKKVGEFEFNDEFKLGVLEELHATYELARLTKEVNKKQ